MAGQATADMDQAKALGMAQQEMEYRVDLFNRLVTALNYTTPPPLLPGESGSLASPINLTQRAQAATSFGYSLVLRRCL